MEKKQQTGLSPKELWKKHKSNILFVLFLAWMILFPQNPVRIWMTKGVGWVRMMVEPLEKKPEKYRQLTVENKEWQITGLDGQTYRLKDFEGKPLVINVWATWCPPCVAELPSLESLYREYGDRVHFIFLADDRPDKVKAFLQQRQLDIPVYFSASRRPFALRSESIPTTFVLDKNMQIRVRKTGAMDWHTKKVTRLLDKYIKE